MKFLNKKEGDQVDFTLMKLIVALLKKLQEGKCLLCKIVLKDFEIHHKKYGDDITIYDLALLCKKCHYGYRKQN